MIRRLCYLFVWTLWLIPCGLIVSTAVFQWLVWAIIYWVVKGDELKSDPGSICDWAVKLPEKILKL